MIKRVNVILPVLVLGILLFCSGNQDEFYTIETVGGITEIHNFKPLWGSEQKVKLEFVQKIGDLDTTDDNYAFFHPGDIALDNTGNIYVLDAGNFRIQKFDPSGGYLATFGREGEGPGEFMRPASLQISPENHMYIYDSRKRMVIVLDENGSEINTMRSQNNNYRNYFHLNSGNFIANTQVGLKIMISNEKEAEAEPLLTILDADHNVIGEFCLPEDIGGSLLNYTMNALYIDADEKDNISVAFSKQNRIEKYSADGKLLWKADRQLPYEMSKPEEPNIIIDGSIDSPTRIIIRKSATNTFSRTIAVDNHNRSWVLSVLKQETGSEREGNFEPAEEIIEIYDENGILLCRLPLPDIDTISKFKIFGDRIFFIDPTTEMAVYEYKIVEN